MATFLANLTAGADPILGTAGDDIIQVPPCTSNLSGSDTIAAGAGFDTLLFLRDTSLAVGHTLLTNVSGVDEFDVTLAPSVHIFLNDGSIPTKVRNAT
ncbi:MAG: hypothetical protein IPF96_21290 [Rhodobacter sp.]|nr:hypothetical protein [Rhodobacter sp.]